MRVLALDFGTTTGWAVGGNGLPTISGTWDLKPPRGASPGMRYLRLLRFLEEIRAGNPGLKLVVYEQAHQRGGEATEYAIGCATHLQSWCEQNGFEFVPVHSATLKKHATGRGNAKKPEIIAAAVSRGWKPADDNEADAMFLLDYGLKEVLGEGVAQPKGRGRAEA